jgi:hypothetical protein
MNIYASKFTYPYRSKPKELKLSELSQHVVGMFPGVHWYIFLSYSSLLCCYKIEIKYRQHN